MITNKIERSTNRFPKDAAITSSLHKKVNVANTTARLKPVNLSKPKQEPFATPVSRIKNKKHQKCFPPPETPKISKKTPSTLKMKSVSLIDLSSEDRNQRIIKVQRKTVSREQGDVPKPTKVVEKEINNVFNSNNIFNFKSTRESELAKYVCRKFILNVWRKRRAQANNLKFESKSLQKEVESLKIQTCVLKTFLESERARVNNSMNKLNNARKKLAEEQKISKELNENLSRKEKSLSEGKELWQSMEIQMKERIECLKTELDQAVEKILNLNDEAASYKQQLDDSRENLGSLKVKLEVSKTDLKDQIICVNTLQKKCLELQMTIEGLVTRNQELAREKESKEKQIREYIKNLKNVEVELNNFQNVQKVQSSDFVKLRNDYEEMKAQIINKDLEIGSLQETINLYKAEEIQLMNRFKTVALRVFQLSLNLIPLPNYIPF